MVFRSHAPPLLSPPRERLVKGRFARPQHGVYCNSPLNKPQAPFARGRLPPISHMHMPEPAAVIVRTPEGRAPPACVYLVKVNRVTDERDTCSTFQVPQYFKSGGPVYCVTSPSGPPDIYRHMIPPWPGVIDISVAANFAAPAPLQLVNDLAYIGPPAVVSGP